jgi:hypothetical protein
MSSANIDIWWQALPALPASPEAPAYAALKRMWADATILKRGGFYRADSEDHIMVVLFENWAAMPDCSWVGSFVESCGAGVSGKVVEAGWSFEYTQNRPGQSPPKLTCDIVVWWRDNAGEAVLVLEAKKPGNQQWHEKDIPSTSPYTDVPGFAGIKRRSVCLLIAESDARAMAGRLAGEPVITWERLGGMQMEAFKKLDVPDSVRSFLIGALVHQYALYGIMPQPLPFDWMRDQPPLSAIVPQYQSGQERRVAYWKAPRVRS